MNGRPLQTCPKCKAQICARRRDGSGGLYPHNCLTDEIVSDLLLLVCYDVPLKAIREWSHDARVEVQFWAAKTHLRASDNPVRVPPKPPILDAYSPQKFGGIL